MIVFGDGAIGEQCIGALAKMACDLS